MLTFLHLLEEKDNLGKHSDTGWKPEGWNECRDAIQQVYQGKGQISVDKIKSQVKYVSKRVFIMIDQMNWHYYCSSEKVAGWNRIGLVINQV